ncbi:MAG TPA: carbon starvation protein A [Vicinamibacterales bacterium]|nr:carbon starvation protein A [Vicinamibacterales bacterium]
MRALYLLLTALGVMAIAYRYYSAFIATRIWMLDNERKTPAHTKYDGANYYPTTRWVLFGHHFAAISGAGPLIGPTLAAQFGYAPGFIWLVAGCCLAGAVHDSMILWASTRRGGRSLPEIVKQEISPFTGFVAAVAIFFIIVIALAGLGINVVNALAESQWGTFTIAATIPLAIFMGFWMYRWRQGKIAEATIIGCIGLVLAVVLGAPLNEPDSTIGSLFHLSRNQLVIALMIYGFAASVLPVWMLLSPRDYLSSFMKIGTIGFLALGIIIVNPVIQMPALTEFADGGGPVIPGQLFPFCFITIACGAISGFHALISSGTTPKMIDKESDIRPVGYGAMLMEGVVGVMALIAASAMPTGDYFAINVPSSTFANLTFQGQQVVTQNLPALEAAIGETLEGRASGAASLAAGMAYIFSALPGMGSLLGYWYHFAIMFEALFILTTIDAGTRVGRFLFQEFMGRAYAPLARPDNKFGSIFATLVIVSSWGYLISTGQVATIWPAFAVANQLGASVALAVATSILINSGKARYAWVTVLPLCFLAVNTLWGGFLNVRDNYYPLAIGTNAARNLEGWVLTVYTIIMLALAVIVLGSAVSKWISVLGGGPVPATAEERA